MYGIWACCSTFSRVWGFFEARIWIWIRIRIRFRVPHQIKNHNPYPHQRDADPQRWFQETDPSVRLCTGSTAAWTLSWMWGWPPPSSPDTSSPFIPPQDCMTRRRRTRWFWHTRKPVFFLLLALKWQCHEIFIVMFFSWISFPQVPEYCNRAVSNFFENSRRCSQLKVHQHHWCR